MTQIAMAKLAGRAVMLHAGAVSRADGQILALVTESGGGKTTAVIEFARNGWGYVTDETLAVVDGAVLPFPKPLSLVMHPSAPDAKMLVSAEALGLGECPETLSMGHLVLLNRDPAASLPELTPLQPVEAAWRLIPHSSHLLDFDAPLQALAGLASSIKGCWTFAYRDIWASKDLLAEAPDLPPRHFAALPLSNPHIALPAQTYGHGQVRDAIIDAESAALLINDTPVHLDLLTATVFEAAFEPSTAAEIVAHTVACFGDHPDAAALVKERLAFLVERGALRAG